jgi:CBS domain-containing protein
MSKDRTGLQVKDVMSDRLITLSVEDSMDKADILFRELKIHHIPVVDSNNNLIGLVSKSDYHKILHGKTLFKSENIQAYNKALLRTLLVIEVMVKNPVVVYPQQPIRDVVELFKQNLFRALPVIENKKLVGIITPIDLLELIVQVPAPAK